MSGLELALDCSSDGRWLQIRSGMGARSHRVFDPMSPNASAVDETHRRTRASIDQAST